MRIYCTFPKFFILYYFNLIQELIRGRNMPQSHFASSILTRSWGNMISSILTRSWGYMSYWAQLLTGRHHPDGSVVKESASSAGDTREVGSIPRLGRSSGGRRGNPLQYCCLENPMDSGAWWATVHGVTKIQTLVKWLSKRAHPNREGHKKVSVTPWTVAC